MQPSASSFDDVVAAHRSALLAHCYRMTGSLHDAEDAVQETLVRGWRAYDSFEGRSSVRTWLFTIATNVCRRQLEQRARRMLPVDLGPASQQAAAGDGGTEVLWLTPFAGPALETSPSARYEHKESVELAFVAALQLLPARQRAALLLRDVLGFSAAETADVLGSSVPSANSALQRARALLAGRLPEHSQQRALQVLGDAAARDLVERFVTAWERNDVASLVRLLADDVEFSMPPQALWLSGTDDVARFLERTPLSPGRRWRGVPIEVNAQLACALWVDEGRGYVPEGITVLTVRDGLVAGLTAFRDPTLHDLLGLVMPGERER